MFELSRFAAGVAHRRGQDRVRLRHARRPLHFHGAADRRGTCDDGDDMLYSGARHQTMRRDRGDFHATAGACWSATASAHSIARSRPVTYFWGDAAVLTAPTASHVDSAGDTPSRSRSRSSSHRRLFTPRSPDDGRQAFVTRCASCHGSDGNGGELGPAIAARAAPPATPNCAESSGMVFPARECRRLASLTDPETADPIAFVRTLRPRNAPDFTTARFCAAANRHRASSGRVMNQTHDDVQVLDADRHLHLLRGARESGTARGDVAIDWACRTTGVQVAAATRQLMQITPGERRQRWRRSGCSACRTPRVLSRSRRLSSAA